MTLIVETGDGLANADSYISVADADARHAALGNSGWTGADAVKESALRRATEYLEQAYSSRWKGTRLMRAQALSWPRYGVEADGYALPSSTVPAGIANVCADLALQALSGPLNPNLERGIVREKVGPLETEYDRNSPQATRYRAVDMALAVFLKSSGATVPLVRA